jgi:hypothetical protein
MHVHYTNVPTAVKRESKDSFCCCVIFSDVVEQGRGEENENEA